MYRKVPAVETLRGEGSMIPWLIQPNLSKLGSLADYSCSQRLHVKFQQIVGKGVLYPFNTDSQRKNLLKRKNKGKIKGEGDLP